MGAGVLDLRRGAVPAADAATWHDPAEHWRALTQATRHLDAPVGALHLGALRHNASDMARRAGGTPIRIATKSIRVREVIDALLCLPGYRGVLAYTLTEAIWLAERIDTLDDLVVGYPTAEAGAIRRLVTDADLARRITVMVDSPAQLDLIDAVLPPDRREEVRVCLELDASWQAPVLGHLGVRRSPVHHPDEAGALAAYVADRAGFRLVGVMSYEAQVAGVADRPPGRPVDGAVNRWMQARSMSELVERRRAAVVEVRRHADLEFVNGGGTGSLELTAADRTVTEIAAGSGIFAGHIFDGYSRFTPAPAAAFALDVVRSPSERHATILGGGWIASGPPGSDRAPRIVWPEGLRMLPREAAGEVQTPVEGPAAARLRPGDRVWLRHAKSGELAEHLNEFAVVDGGEVVATVPTYRGEGKAFL
ncbi:D-serine deaminase-like pyridoxal phosphate-dependent protein [Agromyces flavus]|uniref:D-serine deaminase, pyridoxal phosphate-dependent n=1 Tax=Agromyces flavus TaxID=589382 RepID=A0A1H1N200_9MICO|nr:alanine racemase [Agromyces flavus]MCP2369170.1 D-serine deaminase-like pyridoxal phosphate-dependent protein [Agromyces flavus]GGI48651.1 alanine racemase [Agromyces flavus]SDR92735.1 D-serine deaminase, pyridoxal phosphate-dependent [Agromyces flavus]